MTCYHPIQTDGLFTIYTVLYIYASSHQHRNPDFQKILDIFILVLEDYHYYFLIQVII